MLTNKAETTVSSLIIQKAGVSDGGVYSCQAGQIDPTSVKIHVLTGKLLSNIFSEIIWHLTITKMGTIIIRCMKVPLES